MAADSALITCSCSLVFSNVTSGSPALTNAPSSTCTCRTWPPSTAPKYTVVRGHHVAGDRDVLVERAVIDLRDGEPLGADGQRAREAELHVGVGAHGDQQQRSDGDRDALRRDEFALDPPVHRRQNDVPAATTGCRGAVFLLQRENRHRRAVLPTQYSSTVLQSSSRAVSSNHWRCNRLAKGRESVELKPTL